MLAFGLVSEYWIRNVRDCNGQNNLNDEKQVLDRNNQEDDVAFVPVNIVVLEPDSDWWLACSSEPTSVWEVNGGEVSRNT